ncbi:hypothetical protein HMPREF3219_0201715 [Streptococcus salivarius]|nr:hypothetical protein HMPREF3219_0201715 [Streptococcus salivarius]
MTKSIILTAATCLQFFSFPPSQLESLIYAKMELLRFKKEMQ